MKIENPIEELARRIRLESKITVLTGAGVSAASGIPTFRGKDGLWKNQPPEQLATPQAFERDPRLVWEWYNWRRERISRCQPNAAHHVLATWSARHRVFTLITQNVDGLHERAGTKGIIRFHGSIWEVLCWNRCAGSPSRWWDDNVPFNRIPPSCPYCGGLLRPGVVWFGEGIDQDVIDRSLAALDCDVFLSIGTSAVVYPAAALAGEAHRRGAFTAEINPEATPASSSFDLAIQDAAESALPQLEMLIGSRNSEHDC